jgi:hypothetical protein
MHKEGKGGVANHTEKVKENIDKYLQTSSSDSGLHHIPSYLLLRYSYGLWQQQRSNLTTNYQTKIWVAI